MGLWIVQGGLFTIGQDVTVIWVASFSRHSNAPQFEAWVCLPLRGKSIFEYHAAVLRGECSFSRTVFTRKINQCHSVEGCRMVSLTKAPVAPEACMSLENIIMLIPSYGAVISIKSNYQEEWIGRIDQCRRYSKALFFRFIDLYALFEISVFFTAESTSLIKSF